MESPLQKVKNLIKPSCDYFVEQNIFHFIIDANDRPMTPKLLSKELYDLYSDAQNFVSQKRESNLSLLNKNEHYEKNFIEYAKIDNGVIVDIATGPHGGWVHGILESLSKDAIIISTDACSFCIDSYSSFYNNCNYYYFDTDLDKPLPFNDKSIDVFTGVLLCNVPNYRGLLTEIARCLKPGGKAVFEEVFYSSESETYFYLIKEDAIYASSETYVSFCESIGLDLAGIDVCKKSIGKVDPGDGLPILESDEWYRKNIYLVKTA